MVSNYDRVYQEIRKEAEVLAASEGLPSETLVRLALEIVDLEDQHNIRPLNIKQRITSVIRTAAAAHIENHQLAGDSDA